MLKLSSSSEHHPGDGEQLGHRVAEAGQPTERPAAERQGHEPGDGDQLEGDAVRAGRCRRRRSPAPARPCRSGTTGMPAYQSMLHPVSWKLDSRWSRRNAGPQTWAPMSPPVGVVSAKTRSPNIRWTTFIMTTVVMTSVSRGDRDADDALRRPRPFGPLHRAADDATAGARGPGRFALVAGRLVLRPRSARRAARPRSRRRARAPVRRRGRRPCRARRRARRRRRPRAARRCPSSARSSHSSRRK